MKDGGREGKERGIEEMTVTQGEKKGGETEGKGGRTEKGEREGK